MIQTGESRKAEHGFDGDRHGGALFQRQERALSASGPNLEIGNTEVKAWLFSSVYQGSCYVCIQLTGS